jgi:hypothetical protein
MVDTPPAKPAALQTSKGQQVPLQDPIGAQAAMDRLKSRGPGLPVKSQWQQLAFGLLDKVQAGLEAVNCPACKNGLVAGIIKVERSKFERLVKDGN